MHTKSLLIGIVATTAVSLLVATSAAHAADDRVKATPPGQLPTGGGGAYATGIVSGIIGGGDNCTSRPSTATRKCSTTVLYAPVSNFLHNNTNYGIYTALPSGA